MPTEQVVQDSEEPVDVEEPEKIGSVEEDETVKSDPINSSPRTQTGAPYKLQSVMLKQW